MRASSLWLKPNRDLVPNKKATTLCISQSPCRKQKGTQRRLTERQNKATSDWTIYSEATGQKRRSQQGREAPWDLGAGSWQQQRPRAEGLREPSESRAAGEPPAGDGGCGGAATAHG